MWNVSIAAIPGPWPALPVVAPWLVGSAAVLAGLAFVLVRAAGRLGRGERPADARMRRLHGVRAA